MHEAHETHTQATVDDKPLAYFSHSKHYDLNSRVVKCLVITFIELGIRMLNTLQNSSSSVVHHGRTTYTPPPPKKKNVDDGYTCGFVKLSGKFDYHEASPALFSATLEATEAMATANLSAAFLVFRCSTGTGTAGICFGRGGGGGGELRMLQYKYMYRRRPDGV